MKTERWQYAKGFTLSELLITLAIVAVLAALAVPGLQQMLRNNRLTAETNKLVSSLYLARSEAVKRNLEVALCGSGDGEKCTGEWNKGWIVIADPADTEEILQDVRAPKELDIHSPVNAISFYGDGVSDVQNDASSIVLVNASFRRVVKVTQGGSVKSCRPAAGASDTCAQTP